MHHGERPFCSEHPGASAGWLCAACARSWCVDCVARRWNDPAAPVACRRCSGAVSEARVPRDPRSYAAIAVSSWSLALSPPVARTVAVAAVGAGALSWACRSWLPDSAAATWSPLPFAIAVSALTAARAVEGEAGLTARSGRDVPVLLAGALSALPGLVLAGVAAGLGSPDAAIGLGLAGGVVSAVWFPSAVASAAAGAGLREALGGGAARVWRGAGSDAATAAAFFALGAIASLAGVFLSPGLAFVLAVPLVPHVVAAAAALVPAAAAGAAVGLLVYARGAGFGAPARAEALRPALPGVLPDVFEKRDVPQAQLGRAMKIVRRAEPAAALAAAAPSESWDAFSAHPETPVPLSRLTRTPPPASKAAMPTAPLPPVPVITPAPPALAAVPVVLPRSPERAPDAAPPVAEGWDADPSAWQDVESSRPTVLEILPTKKPG